MKTEWRKQEKEIYLPKATPSLVAIPKYSYFIISGQGNPNETAFEEKVGLLYSLSYSIKMLPKKGVTPKDYYDYTVYPLEGVWDMTETGKAENSLNKQELLYTLMIRQPEFVTEELAVQAILEAKKKTSNDLFDTVSFCPVEEGLSVQILHKGPYDTEQESFARLEAFCIENKLLRRTENHKEIYLNNAKKTAPEALKTVLRWQVKRIAD